MHVLPIRSYYYQQPLAMITQAAVCSMVVILLLVFAFILYGVFGSVFCAQVIGVLSGLASDLLGKI